MAKIKDLPVSYLNAVLQEVGLQERKPMHENRAKICHECTNGGAKCPACGCPLFGIIAGPITNCDLNKWEQ